MTDTHPRTTAVGVTAGIPAMTPVAGLTLNEYQRQSMRTAVTPEGEWDRQFQTSGFGLGLTGEAGEVLELAVFLNIKAANAADMLKKQIHHEHGLNSEAMKKELGDVLWYVQGIASRYGLTLEEVAQGNIDKLKARYPQGWTAEDSINRENEAPKGHYAIPHRCPEDCPVGTRF